MVQLYKGDCLIESDKLESGSTGVACVNTFRKFIGIEMDEKYFNIATNRIEEAQELNDLL